MKKLELIKKIYFFDKNKPINYGNGWGIRSDWANFLDEKNPRNMYGFVNELIREGILNQVGTVLRDNNREEEKFKLKPKRLKKIVKEMPEYQLFKNIVGFID